MTLTEFLLARLDEDEAAARAVPAGPWVVELDDGRPYPSLVVEGPPPPPGAVREDQGDRDDPVRVVDSIEEPRIAEYVATFDPTRVLAEVLAKRQIITLAYEATGLDLDRDLDRATGARAASGIEFVGERMLRAIASPYAGHPDYEDVWRP
jgi:hypothetical protein